MPGARGRPATTTPCVTSVITLPPGRALWRSSRPDWKSFASLPSSGTVADGRPYVGWSGALLAHEHGLSFALEVEELRAADVHRDAPDGATGETPRLVTRVVGGDPRAAVAAYAQPLTGDHELAGLGLDIPLADLGVPVPQREHSDGHARRVLSGLVEGGGQQELLAGR